MTDKQTQQQREPLLRMEVFSKCLNVCAVVSALALAVLAVRHVVHRSYGWKDVLCETDPHELLVAGRTIISNRMSYRKPPNVTGAPGARIDPDDPSLPEIIRKLRPRLILVFSDYQVFIGLGGKYFGPGGLSVFSADYSSSVPKEDSWTMKVRDGLYYKGQDIHSLTIPRGRMCELKTSGGSSLVSSTPGEVLITVSIPSNAPPIPVE